MTDFRDVAFELVEDGMVDPMMMLTAALKYMSQDEVKDMLEINELMPEEDEDDGQPDWHTEWADFGEEY